MLYIYAAIMLLFVNIHSLLPQNVALVCMSRIFALFIFEILCGGTSEALDYKH